ncbi:MAG: hypothetical protein OXI26_02135 [bacterium]|nr:hypothetical protein [bacterium]
MPAASRSIYGVSCPVHGPVHVAWDWVTPGTLAYRCTVETGDGTRCGPIELPPPPRLPWHTRILLRLPSRAAVEWTMATLVIGFWIGAVVWIQFFV